MWFEELTGFREKSPAQVRTNLTLEGTHLRSLVNGKTWDCGTLETPRLEDLRKRAAAAGFPTGSLSVREVVANVQTLHADPANAGALFQVASQFNLLEMTSPMVTPEEGIGIYEHDYTQGPACAIAAGAGTIFRCYYVPIGLQTGQTAKKQIDCLADLGEALGNSGERLWKMQNGYALANPNGLEIIAARLRASSEAELAALRGLLRIGLQWNTQVTLPGVRHAVSQAYCSALPVAYSHLAPALWEPFARLVLEAAYEATLCAAVLHAKQRGCQTVYLTLLGGGAFGNSPRWILDAAQNALRPFRHAGLDVVFVSYGATNPSLRPLLGG